MVQLKDIDKIINYSQICEGYEIRDMLNLEIKKGEFIKKIMRNNFGRFWNMLKKEQREKWIKISTNKELKREDIDKIIRYADEIEKDKFIKEYLNQDDDLYENKTEEYMDDDKNDVYNLKHNILLFWIGQKKEKKIKLIRMINEYWEKNEYEEYEQEEKKEYDCKEKMYGYDNKYIDNNIKYLCCTNEEIEKLENLPNNLEVLICEGNKIKSLKKLPKTLKVLMCRDNEIEELILPKGLRYLSCENNKIRKLKLSPYIEELYCDDEYIGYDNIPNMIKILEIEEKENEIKSKLPYGLEEIKGGITKIESVMLPKSIKKIDDERTNFNYD